MLFFFLNKLIVLQQFKTFHKVNYHLINQDYLAEIQLDDSSPGSVFRLVDWFLIGGEK